ncbi:MAG: shikimate kinase [Chryseolinea sp.]
MKVFLIGLPGSGKSTIGASLAARLDMEFVDLDKEIESQEGMIIPEIFSAKGEDYFRRVESEMLRQWAVLERSFVMSTGGGTPCFHNGIDVINDNGVSVFLDEQIEVIVARLGNNQQRPLLQSVNVEDMRGKLQRLREVRLPFYQQARITVPSPTVGTVLEKLGMKNQ